MNTALPDLARTAPGHAMRPFWTLEPEMHYLNHGAFGATPAYVLAAADHWRRELERQPTRFVTTRLAAALRATADRLANFLGTSGERIALLENATDGVNAVLRSVDWRPGDEIVVANHAYPAIRNTAGFVAQRFGLTVVEAHVPFPLDDQQQIIDAYEQAITPKTRLLIVDHVFSPLALIAPVAEIVARCKRRQIPVLVDGAHAPGMLPLSLDALGADWYTGNCHKWLLAPKACAFLYASPAGAVGLHPTAISNFHDAGFPGEFDWQGTRDYSSWLAVTAALDFLDALGVERYRQYLRELAGNAAGLLADAWGMTLPFPENAIGAMATLPLPLDDAATRESAAALHDHLWNEQRIEVPVMAFNERLWVRISAQVYNDISDYAALGEAIRRMCT